VTRGWSEDRTREAAEALSATHGALDRDPSDALALATEGFVYCHLLNDLDTARKRCEQAVDANPSHPWVGSTGVRLTRSRARVKQPWRRRGAR
jgi:adenylate cyclase